MLCLALSVLVEDKNIMILKQLMLHGKVWKAFCLEAVLHKQFFPLPSLVPSPFLCQGRPNTQILTLDP